MSTQDVYYAIAVMATIVVGGAAFFAAAVIAEKHRPRP